MRPTTVAALAVATLSVAACSSETAPEPSASPTTEVTAAEVAATASASATANPVPTDDAPEPGTYAIECDPAGHARDSAVTVLGPHEWRVAGWNHIIAAGSFETVAQEPSAYAITAERYVEHPDCGGQKALDVVLVKKTYDWDRQHANGMEASFPGEGLTFGDVGDVVVEMRIDSADTVIPGADALAGAYGDMLDSAQLAELDAGDVNLELTLYGEGASGDQPFMNAGLIIAVDPDEFADEWVRVAVPRDALTFYTEDNYVRTEVGPEAYQDLLVQGLRINPETATGATVRRLVTDAGEDFDPQAKPELFKEMALSLSLVQVGRAAQ